MRVRVRVRSQINKLGAGAGAGADWFYKLSYGCGCRCGKSAGNFFSFFCLLKICFEPHLFDIKHHRNNIKHNLQNVYVSYIKF